MSLTQYFRTNAGRPIHKWAHYLPVYERHFARFRDRSIFFLEIGSGQGGSSQMWKNYFGPLATIVTVDIRPECLAFEDEQVRVRIGDQADPHFLGSLVDEFGCPDVVLDDGSHIMEHVKATFNYIYPRCNREAVYLVEDMHTAYWPAWGGGLRKPGTFIEEMKNLIDELSAENPHNAEQGAGDMPSSEVGRCTRSIAFYDSIVVLEKGPFLNKASMSIPFVEGQTIW